MPASVASAAAGAVAGKVAGKLLGGGKKSSGSSGPGFIPFRAGGLNSAINSDGQVAVAFDKFTDRGATRREALEGIKRGFLNSASDVRGLIPRFGQSFDTRLNELGGFIDQVSPGFGRLTDARVQSIRNQRDQTISNAVDDFARRGILGSSLAQSALSSIDSEFAEQESEARALSFLEELDLSTRLTEERFQTDISGLQNELDNLLLAGSFDRASSQADIDELNTQLNAGLAAMGAATQAATQAKDLEMRLAAQNAVGQGNLAALMTKNISDSGFSGNLFGGGNFSNQVESLGGSEAVASNIAGSMFGGLA